MIHVWTLCARGFAILKMSIYPQWLLHLEEESNMQVKPLKEMLKYGILQVRILQMSTKRFKVTKLSENFVENWNNQEPQSSK
jgi:CRISPR/Cas system-associated protein endoribonuclease Cas2